MTTLLAHFDGKVLVPEVPVQLPQGRIFRVQVEEQPAFVTPLMAIYNAIKDLPDDPDTPTDLAAQHAHYLHGAPKRP